MSRNFQFVSFSFLKLISENFEALFEGYGTRRYSWLRHCAINRKVAGSILGEFIGIFHWFNPSDRIMALESTQHLTEISTRSIYWG